MKKFLLSCTFLLISVFAIGQSQDTLAQSTKNNENSPFAIFSMFTGNPGKAALFSLVLPSAGQFYNKKLWKVPVVLAIEGIAIYNMVDKINNFNYWNNGLIDLSNETITEIEGITNINDVKSIRDRSMQNRDYAIIGVALIHLFQTAEAFVNRHLIEFDVSDDLSYKLKLSEQNLGLTLAFKF